MLPSPFRDFQLCERSECRNRNILASLRDPSFARQWLLRHRHDFMNMMLLRSLLSRQGAPHLLRLTDEEVIQEAAELLVSGRLHVHAPVLPATIGFADHDLKEPAPSAPFPLSARKSSRASSSAPAVNDPPTFPPGTAPSAQAATLVSAAAEGAPFCPV